MPSPTRLVVTQQRQAAISSAYNEAGYRYGKYADCNARDLFAFEGAMHLVIARLGTR
jgi:hypothetical protein